MPLRRRRRGMTGRCVVRGLATGRCWARAVAKDDRIVRVAEARVHDEAITYVFNVLYRDNVCRRYDT